MPKVKVADASGPVLDWMVCRAQHPDAFMSATHVWLPVGDEEDDFLIDEASTDWSQGGPIVERERIELHNANSVDYSGEWVAHSVFQKYAFGPTPLVAAMRCYVVSKLGEKVKVPDELC